MDAMIVGLLSAYKEGHTFRHALRSALAACDHVVVFDGPAGEPLEADVPESEYGDHDAARVTVQHGRWRTDARKRQAMLEWSKRYPAPTWGLWLDGDEVLVNPEYLRDWVQHVEWQDELEAKPSIPTARIPLRVVELGGAIQMNYAKLVRVDLIASYDVSIANVTNAAGVAERAGMLHEHIGGWLNAHPEASKGFLYWPPGPGPLDPFIVHRSMLRHPLRAGLRLHDQERVELAALERDAASGNGRLLEFRPHDVPRSGD